MIQSERQILVAKIHDYNNLEKYVNSAKNIGFNHSEMTVVADVFKVMLNQFDCFQLAEVMPVCKKFFLLAREVILMRQEDLIAEKRLLQKHLEDIIKAENALSNDSFSIYSGPTGC